MRAKKRFYIWKRNSSSLIDDNKISVPNFISISWKHVLNELCMGFEQINSHNCIFVLFVITQNFFEVKSFLEAQNLKTLDNKFEKSFQIVG